MKHIFLFSFLVLFFSLQAQPTRYSKVRVDLNGQSLTAIASLGIAVDNARTKAGLFAELQLNENELSLLEEAGYQYEILEADMAAFYQQRYAQSLDEKILLDPADEFPVPENWELGSMGGFYTYQQVLDKLDFMAAQWPDLITVRAPINEDLLTHNGNPIWWIKISDNPNEQEEEPQVLYTGIHHAREGVGVQQMIYFMLHLLENYDTSEEIQTLVNSRELYFVPIINPDGYLYNEQTNPNGGGMWRKNRRNNGGSYGVDINRNYGYKWGLDDNGSSPSPSSETYRGPSAFSEPETQNIKQFVEEHDFKIALNYHSYSNLLLYAWGYQNAVCPDDDIFNAHAKLMTRDNHYTYGPGGPTIYPTNGGSDDWMYGDSEERDPVFAYTPEVGSQNDGFWPAANRIVPLCQENMIQNMRAAWFVGSYGVIQENAEPVISSLETFIPFDLQRIGFGETAGWTVSVIPLDENIVSVGEPMSFGSLEMLETITDSIAISLSADLMSRDEFRFLLQLDNGEFITTDTITKLYGTTTTIFADSCNALTKWTSAKWNITENEYHTPTGSIADSPFGNYAANENNIITLIEPIELPATSMALLRFYAKWDIEYDYDYVQLQLRTGGTGSWTALEGKHTRPGSSNQSAGKPVYDGQSDWVAESIDLTTYAGESIELRFVLRSDVYVEADGFYFDDFELLVLDIETGIPSAQAGSEIEASVFPNPATEQLHITLRKAASQTVEMALIDLRGKQIMQSQMNIGQQKITLDCSAIPAGIYLVKISEGTLASWEKVVIQ